MSFKTKCPSGVKINIKKPNFKKEVFFEVCLEQMSCQKPNL